MASPAPNTTSASASDAKAAPAAAAAAAPVAAAAPAVSVAGAAAGAGAAASSAAAASAAASPSSGAAAAAAGAGSGAEKAVAARVWEGVPAATRQGLLALYGSVTCGALVPGKHAPVVIDSHASVKQASALLAERHISSAPVYDKNADTYLRLLDYVDINAFILQFLLEGHRQNLLTNNNSQLDEMLGKTAVTIIPSGFHTTGELTKQHPFFAVKNTDPLLVAIKLFTQQHASKARVYRVAVLDAHTGKFTSVLSQSDVIRWFASHLNDEHIKAVASKSLAELNLVQCEVTSISGSAKLFEAFVLLAKRQLSSVAVVDGDGLFLGAVQHSHIRAALTSRLYANLTKTCAEVLAEQMAANAEDDPLFACVDVTATLHSCIKRAAGHHFQRLWVLAKDDNKPVGVVALSDILRVLSGGH